MTITTATPRLLTLTALLLATGCGGGLPTGPTPPAPVPTTVTVPAPVAPVQPKDPPVDPPAPTPPPTPPPPVPTPRPQPQLLLDATATSYHWFHDGLPAGFVIEVWPDAIWMGDVLRVSRIGDPHDGTVIAKDADGLFTMHPGGKPGTWVWDYTGWRGTAMGEATERRR